MKAAPSKDIDDDLPEPIRDRLRLAPEPVAMDTLTKEASSNAAGDADVTVQTVGQAVKKGPSGLAKLLGPGLITGASDDDPSGIGTYSQAGSQFGFGLLWLSVYTFPLMLATQEACARIALHTGVDLATALRRKFPTWLVAVCVIALAIANVINIGADLAAVAAGGSLLTAGRLNPEWLLIPVGLAILAMQVWLPYSIIFRTFRWLTLALFAYVITVFIVHPPLLATLQAAFVPHFELSAGFMALLVAILGTTISPYLFFWQTSSEVDEMRRAGGRTEAERRGVSNSELSRARTDVAIGMGFSQFVMFSIIVTTAVTLHTNGQTNITSAQQAASALAPLAGRFASTLFAIGLIGTGLLAIPILAGSAAYAISGVFRIPGNLMQKPRYRPTFYGVIGLAMAGGMAMSISGVNPIKALVLAAIANGLVAPPILILTALLACDRNVMGSRRSGRVSMSLLWITTAAMSVAALLMLALTVAG